MRTESSLNESKVPKHEEEVFETQLFLQIKQIVAGDYFTCALMEENISCWGQGFSRATANGLSNLKKPSQIAAGANHLCAITEEGVKCWDSRDVEQIEVPASIQNPIQLAAAGSTTCALLNSEVICWDRKSYNLNYLPKMPIKLNDIKKPTRIYVGLMDEYSGANVDTICVSGEGGVYCWRGYANFYKLENLKDPVDLVFLNGRFVCGTGVFEDPTIKFNCWDRRTGKVADVDFKNFENSFRISTGEYSRFCAIIDSSVRCDGSSAKFNMPSDLKNPQQIVVGRNHACALTEKGVKCWNGTEDGLSCGLNNRPCTLGGWSQSNVPSGLHNLSKMTIGYKHGCAISEDGIKCWGENYFGQLQVPSGVKRPYLLSAGDYHTCVADDEGVKCWGSNKVGKYPDPYAPIPEWPVPEKAILNPLVVPMEIRNQKNISQLVSQGKSTCALSSSGVTCWASWVDAPPYLDGTKNPDPGFLEQFSFLPSELNNPKQIAVNEKEACAVSDDGVRCWSIEFRSLDEHNKYRPKLYRYPFNIKNAKLIAMKNDEICLANPYESECYSKSYKKIEAGPQLKNPTQIAKVYFGFCANTSDGLKCWENGKTVFLDVTDPRILKFKDITKISEIIGESLCVISNGKLSCNKPIDFETVLTW